MYSIWIGVHWTNYKSVYANTMHKVDYPWVHEAKHVTDHLRLLLQQFLKRNSPGNTNRDAELYFSLKPHKREELYINMRKQFMEHSARIFFDFDKSWCGREVLLIGFLHLLLSSLWIDDFQSLQENKTYILFNSVQPKSWHLVITIHSPAEEWKPHLRLFLPLVSWLWCCPPTPAASGSFAIKQNDKMEGTSWFCMVGQWSSHLLLMAS